MTYIIRIQEKKMVEFTLADRVALMNLSSTYQLNYIVARFDLQGEQAYALQDAIQNCNSLYQGFFYYSAYGEDSGKEYALTEADQMVLDFILNSYICSYAGANQTPSRGDRVAAIKWFRVAFGCGLREAKDAVDQYQKEKNEKLGI